jgi:hypothetical protein
VHDPRVTNRFFAFAEFKATVNIAALLQAVAALGGVHVRRDEAQPTKIPHLPIRESRQNQQAGDPHSLTIAI